MGLVGVPSTVGVPSHFVGVWEVVDVPDSGDSVPAQSTNLCVLGQLYPQALEVVVLSHHLTLGVSLLNRQMHGTVVIDYVFHVWQ